jgi:hypothetical protein
MYLFNSVGSLWFNNSGFGFLATLTASGVFTTYGGINAPFIQSSGVTFTATGCGTVTSLLGGASAGSFHAAATSCAAVITPGVTATNGFSCWANDLTTNADTVKQTATSTTTFTLTGTVVSGDIINFGCLAY